MKISLISAMAIATLSTTVLAESAAPVTDRVQPIQLTDDQMDAVTASGAFTFKLALINGNLTKSFVERVPISIMGVEEPD